MFFPYKAKKSGIDVFYLLLKQSKTIILNVSAVNGKGSKYIVFLTLKMIKKAYKKQQNVPGLVNNLIDVFEMLKKQQKRS